MGSDEKHHLTDRRSLVEVVAVARGAVRAERLRTRCEGEMVGQEARHVVGKEHNHINIAVWWRLWLWR